MNKRKFVFANLVVVLSTTILNVFLAFAEIRIFIQTYGSSVNGLIQTGNQALNYLSLIEGGLCASYLFHMYKSIGANDFSQTSRYYRGLKKSIYRAVCFMIVCGLLICSIYPLFINKQELSYFFVFSVFFLLTIKTILPYAISLAPKQLIILKEKKYIVELISGLTTSITYALEILILKLFYLDLRIMLILCIVIVLVFGLLVKLIARRLFESAFFQNKVADVSPSKLSRDVLPHNISALVFNSTDNIILSVFSDLNSVTLYSNYNMISMQATSVCTRIVDGVTATIGIELTKKDNNAYRLFKMVFFLNSLVSVWIASVYFLMINDFIALWLGQNYILTNLDSLLFAIILLLNIFIPPMQSVVSAAGIFKESKRFVISQAIVNLILTIFLVPFLGITGALIGTLVARLFITVPFNYYYIYKKVFINEKCNIIKEIFVPLASFFASVIICFLAKRYILVFQISNDWVLFVVNTIVISVLSLLIIMLPFIFAYRKFLRDLINRKKSGHN